MLLVLFFAIYVATAFGIAAQGIHGLSATSFVIAVTGSLAIATIFSLAARMQRTQLREFVAALFGAAAGRAA